ncbi:hypothetical protein RclHR1_05910004 [Rhizophagus clarus]|uniref:Uncharacterized protein n=1 Tax=Rhizophagus clarus TaxID=94130 RepID=A0A2Z6RRE4_9GLOM|nr:hypothetical protein RclHR1_05910004 [Rhizophagus clarus]GES79178.1 hypothetical protein RCL_jg6195.t1 [Rhizophagus clarus]
MQCYKDVYVYEELISKLLELLLEPEEKYELAEVETPKLTTELVDRKLEVIIKTAEIKIDEIIFDLLDCFDNLKNVFDNLFYFFEDSNITILDNSVFDLLEKIRNVLKLMISYLEKNAPSFPKFEVLLYELIMYIDELKPIVKEFKKEFKELLDNLESEKKKLPRVAIKTAAGIILVPVIISKTKLGAELSKEIIKKFQPHAVKYIVIYCGIAIGITTGMYYYKLHYIKKAIDDNEKTYEELCKLERLLREMKFTMNSQRIRIEIEKVVINTSRGNEIENAEKKFEKYLNECDKKDDLIKKLKEYEEKIGNFQSYFRSKCI